MSSIREQRRYSSGAESESESDTERDIGPPPKMMCASTSSGCVVRKKNNIWGEYLQDESLADNLKKSTSVHSAQMVISRGPETFHMTRDDCQGLSQNNNNKKDESLKKELDQEMDDVMASASNNNPFDGEHPEDPVIKPSTSFKNKNNKFKDGRNKGGKGGSNNRKRTTPHPSSMTKKVIFPEGADANQVGSLIAKSLSEPKVNLMVRLADTIGIQEAIHLYNKTFDTEKSGGLMVNDGSRRRTPGGVLLLYLREKATPAQVAKIFEDEKEGERKKATAKRKNKRQNQFTDELEQMKARLQEEKKKRLQEDVLKSNSLDPQILEQQEKVLIESMEAELIPPPDINDVRLVS